VQVQEEVIANTTKIPRAEALRLARSMRRVIATRGKRVVTLDLSHKPTDDELAHALLGPSGTLRAPAMVKGTTLVVGFDPAVYGEMLGLGDA